MNPSLASFVWRVNEKGCVPGGNNLYNCNTRTLAFRRHVDQLPLICKAAAAAYVELLGQRHVQGRQICEANISM